MKIRLSQLRQIIAEEARRVARGDWSPEEWAAYNKEHDESSDKADKAAKEKVAARKPVPDQAVKYVIDNFYDKTDGPKKWYGKPSMRAAVVELLADQGIFDPSYDAVTGILTKLYAHPNYKTTGGATS